MLKAAGGGRWLWKQVSKRFANPKLTLSVEKTLRTTTTSDWVNYPTVRDTPAYVYSIRVHNYTDHSAYRLQVKGCNVPVHKDHLDYFTPVPGNSSTAFTVEFLDTHIDSWENLGLLVLGGSAYVGVGPDTPPVMELRLEYTNAGGKKFFTVFQPKLPVEAQNQHGSV